MGLFTALVTLPLAPVRGTAWVAEKLAEEAARELDEEARLRRELARLQLAYELGELDRTEFEQQEDALIDRLMLLVDERGRDEEVNDGDGYEV
jgi:ADP-ribose pyrophosphatase YjhB (NUDIX family)